MWRDGAHWDRFQTVWHPDGRMIATWFDGPATEFIARSRAGWLAGVNVNHFLGGTVVDIAGTRALAETKMTIIQRLTLHDQRVDVLKQYRAQCLLALALVFVFSTTSGVYFQYLPTFLVTQLHFVPSIVFTANIVGVIAFVLGMPLWGMVRDCWGWSWTIAAGAVLNAAICVWFFTLIPTLGPNDTKLIYAFVVVGLGAGCVHAMVPGLISSLFPTAIRQSGFALPYSIGTAVFTGLTPLFLAWLVRDYGLAAPMVQYLATCGVALVIVYAVSTVPHFLGTAQATVITGETLGESMQG